MSQKLANSIYFFISLILIGLFLTGCNGDADEVSNNNSLDNAISDSSNDSDLTQANDQNSYNEGEGEDEEITSDNTEETTSKETTETNPLSKYSSEEIEYARVWLQYGPNQEIDELNARHIPSGTPLNHDDETSATYPEDVIQLAGSRLVDGSVTYSGNGDGTINVYNVPLRWDGTNPAGEEFYTDIIQNTTLLAVDTGDDEQIIRLIKKLNIE
ncbi:hypothetical protein J2T56_002069 [Natronobacillus azotifigens]|uniref:Lipoprotein n=1 Tax=Natronobacillus azotifigens TaxID=472978 RepID=A0A9J6RDV3_9BACI|nr:hypothetical protein [Natronobacillus azotifigens]MCZ0703848.1 hypothetical protein [Natronobacillus azotifigens]